MDAKIENVPNATALWALPEEAVLKTSRGEVVEVKSLYRYPGPLPMGMFPMALLYRPDYAPQRALVYP
jgi:hypothetical protein